MNRLSFRTAFLVLFLNAVFAYAQNPPGARADYFSADHSPGSYLKILESEHVARFQERLGKGDTSWVWSDIVYTLDRFANHPQGLQQLSQMAQMLRRNSAALKYFQLAVDLYPQYAMTWAQYGMFLLATNQVDDSIQKFKQSIAVDPKYSPGYAALAHAYFRKNQLEPAREAAKQARDLGFTGQLPAGLP